MDSTAFAIIFGPIIGLVGTLVGLWLGHHQWRRERDQQDRKLFDEKLQTAYFELWHVVEDAHLTMRASLSAVSSADFSGHLTDVNNFMIRHGLYIERDDRYLVLQYLFWTNEYLRRLVAEPHGREYLLSSMAHDGLSERIDVLAEVQKRAEALRDQLRQRIREVVGAPKSDAWSEDHRPSEELLDQLSALTVHINLENRARRPLMEPPPDDLDEEWL